MSRNFVLSNPLRLVRGLFSIFIFAISGCKDEVTSFESVVSIDSVRNEFVFLENLGNPYALTISCNSGLIFISQNNIDYLVSVYDYEGNLKGEFIKNGIGPDEQLNNINLKIDEKERKIYSFDVEKNYLYIYSLDSIVQGAFDNSLVKYIKFRNIQLRQPIVLNSNKFIDFFTFESDMNTQMGVFDTLGNISPFGNLPDYEHSVSHTIFTEAFFGNIQNIKGHVYINYFWTDYIQKFDSLGNTSNFSFGPDLFIPFFTGIQSGNFLQPKPDLEKSRFAYLSRISEVKDGLALLYNGKMIKEGESSKMIYIFDYDLIPKKQYKIKEDLLFFDGCNDVIFGFSPNKENGIYKIYLN